MDRRTAMGLAELLREEPELPPRPLALVGRGVVVDTFARALLTAGGDRRALAPLPAAGPDQLRGCIAVIACGLSRDAVRSLARARRPIVVSLLRGDDRYAWGVLPGIGAANAVPPLRDGTPDIAEVLRRLAARLDTADALELAARLPVLRPQLEDASDGAAARLAALLALRGRPGGAITILQARTAVANARIAGLAGGQSRLPDIAFAAAAGLALREAGRRLPTRFERAALAYTGTLAVLRAQRNVRR